MPALRPRVDRQARDPRPDRALHAVHRQQGRRVVSPLSSTRKGYSSWRERSSPAEAPFRQCSRLPTHPTGPSRASCSGSRVPRIAARIRSSTLTATGRRPRRTSWFARRGGRAAGSPSSLGIATGFAEPGAPGVITNRTGVSIARGWARKAPTPSGLGPSRGCPGRPGHVPCRVDLLDCRQSGR